LAWIVAIFWIGWKLRCGQRGSWLRPQFRDEAKNLLEHLPWYGDLGHFEGERQIAL
jgi:hypothetical protein